jgi:hypothetical protein
VELFFKWIKQHLRIKRFYGTSENAVRTQIWIAISVYVLVAIIKRKLRLNVSLHTLLQILSLTLFEKNAAATRMILGYRSITNIICNLLSGRANFHLGWRENSDQDRLFLIRSYRDRLRSFRRASTRFFWQADCT